MSEGAAPLKTISDFEAKLAEADAQTHQFGQLTAQKHGIARGQLNGFRE